MRKYVPFAVLVVAAVIGLLMTTAIFRAEKSAIAARFELTADDAADRIQDRINQQIDLLGSVHAFMAANAASVTQGEFASFIDRLRIQSRFSGMQGIGFAAMMQTGDEAATELQVNADYDFTRTVWPDTDQEWRTPIVFLEPQDDRNRAALLYDMYSEPTRRDAMDAALREIAPAATAPVQLVQEIGGDKQAGFLVYVPLFRPGQKADMSTRTRADLAGYVYAPFRAGDFHEAVLGRSSLRNVLVETVDVTDGARTLLFRSPGFDDPGVAANPTVERSFEIAGRQWAVTMRQSGTIASPIQHLGTMVLGALALLFAAALAASTRSQMNAVAAARKLNEHSMQAVQEKELMLQEMKHRIKNSIARIMAMARQTAAASADLAEFNESFSARLQAMANAQDVLTRSRWQRGSLRELLSQELGQVFGTSFSADTLPGPDVMLNEKACQALSLVFHELATNALKYGSGRTDVSWTVTGSGPKRRLRLEWSEHAETAPDFSRKGFGTRLIDANIIGELGGTIERSFEKERLRIVIVIPAKALA